MNITVLAFDYVLAAALLGINDLLYFAGKSYQKSTLIEGGELDVARFRIRLASWDGKPVKLMNNLSIAPHCAVQDIDHSDVYLVPTIAGDVELTLAQNPELIDILRRAAQSGSLIGSNSTGAFFLAEAGLLDNRQATTLWSSVDLFRQKYPAVDLRPDQLLTHDGNILCDAGGTSWFDLGLYLVELFCDHQTAMDTAKYFMVDLERATQLSFSPLVSKKYHGDTAILNIQGWMEEHYQGSVSIEQVGKQFGLSSRSLLRRFKLATGGTPLNYLQDVRLNAASRSLVQSNKTIEEITLAVGYEDISSFIRLFKRRTGFSPSNYRARFKALHVQK